MFPPNFTPSFTPNLRLELFNPLGVGWREDATAGAILDQNMALIDAALGSGSSSVYVNAVKIGSPNFKNSATVTFSVSGSDVTATAGSGAWAALTGDLTETQVLPWDGDTPGTKDTFLSRGGPGLVCVGTTGTAGDYTGSLKLTTLTFADGTSQTTKAVAQVQTDWNASSGIGVLLNKPSIPAAQVNSDWNSVAGVSQISNKPSLATVATSGSYTDLSSKPSIPAAQVNSDWNASSGVAQISNKPSLATVATSGSYTDLSSKPSIPAAQVQTDWNASSGIGVILNKPSLATVATSGSYADLSSKPSIPAAQVQTDWNASSGIGVLLNKPSLATVATSGSYADLSSKPSIPAAQVNSDWNASSGVAQISNKPSLAFLPLAGGTMTGVLTLEASAAGLKDASGAAGSVGNVLSINASGYPIWAAPATSGTVVSVGLVGTTNEITVTGASPITGTGSWTLSLPNPTTFPGVVNISSGDLTITGATYHTAIATAASANWTLTLPTTAGFNTYVLQTDGSGNTSWVAQTASAAGSYLALTGGTLTGALLFTDNTYDIGASAATRPRTGYFGTSVVTPGLKLTGTKNTTINSGATGSDWTLTLPTTAGTNLYVLQTDGSGNTSWVAPSSGGSPGGSSGDIQYNNGSGGLAGSATTITSGGTIAIPSGQSLMKYDGIIGFQLCVGASWWGDGNFIQQNSRHFLIQDYADDVPWFQVTPISGTGTKGGAVVAGQNVDKLVQFGSSAGSQINCTVQYMGYGPSSPTTPLVVVNYGYNAGSNVKVSGQSVDGAYVQTEMASLEFVKEARSGSTIAGGFRFNITNGTATGSPATPGMQLRASGVLNIGNGSACGPANYASNAAAVSAGLALGDVYRNGYNLCIVHS